MGRLWGNVSTWGLSSLGTVPSPTTPILASNPVSAVSSRSAGAGTGLSKSASSRESAPAAPNLVLTPSAERTIRNQGPSDPDSGPRAAPTLTPGHRPALNGRDRGSLIVCLATSTRRTAKLDQLWPNLCQDRRSWTTLVRVWVRRPRAGRCRPNLVVVEVTPKCAGGVRGCLEKSGGGASQG